MPSTLTTVEAITTLGTPAPECNECEGTGTTTYLHGPHEHTRECNACHGAGHRLSCPACTDGTNPGTGDTCTLCDGFAILT
ncbi:hypothetical protein [Streptomyces noursei]|uniref:hypothetical protein n=1 Tax=Streptomyces noursei TaxID=1971 RepID=UPI001678FF1E|nr:hypothetical protein [Streptomyces noursei]MCZ1019842.1 hypothetical protein [Streptomyces noursei]GGX36297.1 hypothetical protein GCM10010341_67180 [Streptomyces noursei]